MMSPKRLILLLIFYISYLMFGASIYYHIEHGEEKQKRAEELKERIEINEYLLDQLAEKNESTQNEILEHITDYCGRPVTDYKNDEYEIPYTWTFYHSFFFAFTVCSTVGYGNISPTTTLGRMIMIAYSVIGIPINGILFAGLGEYFGRTFQAIYRRYKKYKMSHNVHYVPPQLGLITIVFIALIPGMTFFLLLPAWVFSYFENWPYSLAFYYAYVTTTTIGFGDYVPTFQPHQPREFGGWFVVYQIFIIIWFISSLGFLLMIMTFITRGLQSKKLARLEQQLSTNIKATQSRIWNGVTKDVGYLRRILNELYILRFKPVYTAPDVMLSLPRSQSCPELTIYRTESVPSSPSLANRKRAFSECYEETGRAASDSQLDKFDRTKSFESAEALRQTTNLLAKVVSALATVKPPPPEEDSTIEAASFYGGYHGLSDSQILASEWSFPSINDPPRARERACSDFNIRPKWQYTSERRAQLPAHNEWTWSGDNDQIQEAINIRYRQQDREQENLYRSTFGMPPLDYIVTLEDEENAKKPRAKKFSIPDGFRKLFPFRNRPSQDISGSVVSVPEAVQPETRLQQSEAPLANRKLSYLANGNPLQSKQLYSSDGSLSTRHSTLQMNGSIPVASNLTDQPTMNTTSTTSYQRSAAGRAQNPTFSARRTSMFPSLSQRRGSLFASERCQRRGSVTSTAIMPQHTRRSSVSPLRRAERRPSIFSNASEKDMNVLENTTLADLIRALEAVHTQTVLDEAASTASTLETDDLFNLFGNSRSKRKGSAADREPSHLPPILSLFAGDNNKALNMTAANRLHTRRFTLADNQSSITSNATAPNMLTQRRRSAMHLMDPPPSYSEKQTTNATQAKAAQVQRSVVTGSSKFKRRFSVRPTTLQIPPGKAPAPLNRNTNAMQQQQQATTSTTSSTALQTAAVAASSQTALQRRQSLRPSPLAQDSGGRTSSDDKAKGPPAAAASNSSSARLLPLSSRPSNVGTHSPLSRIVQLAQAQRKSSASDVLAAPKPDK